MTRAGPRPSAGRPVRRGLARRLAAGLASLVALTVVLVGAPILFVSVIPIPRHVPTLADVVDALTAPDDGRLFIAALAVVGLLAWVSFTLCVLVEVAAALRRRPARRLPGLGGPQRWAAFLVAALIVTAPTVAAAATPTPASAAPTSTAAAWLETGPGHAATVHPTAATTQRVYVVASGDRLADIAARFLGDPGRYRELALLNTVQDPNWIRPGEQIRLPASARDAGARTHAIGAVSASAGAYIVRPGDRLADIATRFLGDPDRYPELARISGVPDPNQIQGGQQLLVPAGARDLGARPHATGTLGSRVGTGSAPRPANPRPAPRPAAPSQVAPRPAGPQPAAPSGRPPATQPPRPSPRPAPSGPATPANPDAPASPTAQARPSVPASPSASAGPTTGSASPAPSSPAHSSANPSAHSSANGAAAPTTRPTGTPLEPTGQSVPTRAGEAGRHHAEDLLPIGAPLAAAGLLAGLLLAELRRRRRRQTRHRPPGRRLPEPADPQAETNVRAAAQPIAVERLDHALRTLGAALVGRAPESMPDLVGAWLEGDTVHLLLTTPCPNPPAPWIDSTALWTLPSDAELPLPAGQLAPLPALVAAGSQPGRHLLLDLERLGLITLTGHPGHRRDLLRYLAAELASNTWSDHVEVTLAGFDPDEISALITLGGDRIDAVTTTSIGIDRARRRLTRVRSALDHLGVPDPVTGRITDDAADAWTPHVLLIAEHDPADLDALEQLDTDLAAAGRCALAVVAVTSRPVGRWPLHVTDDGHLEVPFLGVAAADGLTAAALPADELDGLAALLATADLGADQTAAASPTDDLDPDRWPRVPPADDDEPWAAGTDAAGSLLTDFDLADLGPVNPDDDQTDAEPAGDVRPDAEAGPRGVHPLWPTRSPSAEPTSPSGHTDAGSRPDTEHDATAHAHAGAGAGAVPTSEPGLPSAADEPSPAIDPTATSAASRAPAQRRPASARHRHTDPNLDADLDAWNTADPSRPRIGVLGPVTLEAPGTPPTERRQFQAEVAVYLASRGHRGATGDQFDEALWPGERIQASTRRTALTRTRAWLGKTPTDTNWLPALDDNRRYRVADGYLLDWALFRRLRARGEARGPAGAGDLRAALALVRGAPLAGADVPFNAKGRNPYPWLAASDLAPHRLTAAIVDTAHHLADLSIEVADHSAARWAVDQAWLADIDRDSDIPWRDQMRVAAAAGNEAELRELLESLMTIREAEVPEDLDRDTYRLLTELMPDQLRSGLR